MKRLALPLAVTALSLAATTPAQAGVEVRSDGPIVNLSVTETVKGKPDIAEVSAGVNSEAKTAVEAMQVNAREMSAVIARIKALGIAEDDIQTTGVNLNAMYDYNQATRRQVFRGYQVSNRVSVTLRDVARTGPVLDALVAAGANDLSGPSFSIDDDTAAKAQARRAAVERAQAMARDYAKWSGYNGVRVLEISESVHSNQPMPQMRMMAMDAVAEAGTPIQPGLVGTAVTVTVTYEMVS